MSIQCGCSNNVLRIAHRYTVCRVDGRDYSGNRIHILFNINAYRVFCMLAAVTIVCVYELMFKLKYSKHCHWICQMMRCIFDLFFRFHCRKQQWFVCLLYIAWNPNRRHVLHKATPFDYFPFHINPFQKFVLK